MSLVSSAGSGEIASIKRFEEEYAVHSQRATSFLAVGDFNVHNKGWLKFSTHNSPEGLELECVCCTHGLTQHVKAPTRGANLLDIVLSDFQSGVTCRVTPGIHDDDHNGVLTKVSVEIPASEHVRRHVEIASHEPRASDA